MAAKTGRSARDSLHEFFSPLDEGIHQFDLRDVSPTDAEGVRFLARKVYV